MAERGLSGDLKRKTSPAGLAVAHVSRNPINLEGHMSRATFWLAIGLLIFAIAHMLGAAALSTSLGKRVLVPIIFVPMGD
jgi:uncharacterized membrane protein YhaH (DUF805 family)